jgi:hypothetical protein
MENDKTNEELRLNQIERLNKLKKQNDDMVRETMDKFIKENNNEQIEKLNKLNNFNILTYDKAMLELNKGPILNKKFIDALSKYN